MGGCRRRKPPAVPLSISPPWRKSWRGLPKAMISTRSRTFSPWRALRPTRSPDVGTDTTVPDRPARARSRQLRRVHADAIEKRTAGMAVGDHAKTLLQIPHGVALVEIEMAVEILNFVA